MMNDLVGVLQHAASYTLSKVAAAFCQEKA